MVKAKTGTENAAQTPAKRLETLLKLARSTRRDQQSLAGTYGEKIAKAVEDEHLHPKAFSAAVKEDRMEPAELADYYDALDYYRDVLGLNERAESAPKLDMELKEEEADDKKSTVTKFPAAATPA